MCGPESCALLSETLVVGNSVASSSSGRFLGAAESAAASGGPLVGRPSPFEGLPILLIHRPPYADMVVPFITKPAFTVDGTKVRGYFILFSSKRRRHSVSSLITCLHLLWDQHDTI